MRRLRFVLPFMLIAGSCTPARISCSGPRWPFYSKATFNNLPFVAIGEKPFGLKVVRPEGCDFMLLQADVHGSNNAALTRLIDAVPLLSHDTVITGRMDGEIVHLDAIDGFVVSIVQVRGLKVLDGKARQDVLDSQYWPPRRQPERDPKKPILSF